jgi:hypothetical protein
MWRRRFWRLRRLGILAGAGLPLLAVAAFRGRGWLAIFCGLTGAILFLPGFFYLYVLTIWHWKDRYKGRHSDLWGALLLIETSGWFKLIYFFRHLLPDAIESVRNRDPDSRAQTEPPPTSGP